MEAIKNIFLSISLTILSPFIRKNKRLILFGSGNNDEFQGNPKYLFLYLSNKNSNREYYWITGSKKLYTELEENKLPVLYKFSFKGFWKILRSHFLVIEKSSQDIYYLKSIIGRFNFLQTWHGTPLKKIGNDAIIEKKGMFKSQMIYNSAISKLLSWLKISSKKKFKLVLSPSETVSKVLLSAFSNNNIKVLGYPRNDVFFNPSLLFSHYDNLFSLESYNKVLLYAPTFRDNYQSITPFSLKWLTKTNEFLIKNKWLLIIKKHPWDNNLEIHGGLSNIKDLSSQIKDIQELLVFTDLLITDYSSTFFDFMLTGKPVIYYSYDYSEYIKNCRGMYFDYYHELPGPFAKNEDILFSLIESYTNWYNNEDYQKRYSHVKKKFNTYTDGQSCERFFSFIDTL